LAISHGARVKVFRVVQSIIGRTVGIRWLLVLIHDTVAAALAWVGAFWLRFNLVVPDDMLANMLYVGAWAIPIQASIFLSFGLYRGIWRYASLHDLKHILGAVAIAGLSVPLIIVLFRVQYPLPRSILLIDPILLLMFMGGSRLAYRTWREYRQFGVMHKQGEPVLVLGAGDAAVSLVKELARNEHWRVVGILDDSSDKVGRLLHGIKVLGSIGEAPIWAEKLAVKQAIIAMPSASQDLRRRAVTICTQADLTVFTVPRLGDLISGAVTISQVRKVGVEDLLGREAVVLDSDGVHDLITNQVVLVTGAGGSIGSELCRQIAEFSPGILVFFESNEFAVYTIEQEFIQKFPDVQIHCVVGDVKNRARIDQIMKHFAPSIVFHAAAYKHVPLMEAENAWEAIQNNVFGTYVLASSAVANRVKKFVLISTDKAVNPTNVMGASKRLAEMVCQSLQVTTDTRFSMVRFGNVLGSTGSVIPKFQEQISRGGPITVTHPDIIRYFMSIPEAAQLVLQAGCMSLGGEIFVLDMGEPVKIVDLAHDMIRLSGLAEDEIKIEFTGLRPGEKLFEELLADDEHTLPTPHPKLRVAKARSADQAWLSELLNWMKDNNTMDDAHVRRDLKKWVPEYSYLTKPQLKAVSEKKTS
jgi:FlaA1/EpsC-like NDP-sugar epimerase